MISVEDALARVLADIRPICSPHAAPLGEALGRYAAAPVTALVDLPPFDNSAMDGYAVRSEDLKAALPQNPQVLACASIVAAGDKPDIAVAPGACARIFTGSPLPQGADAVVMQEDVEADGTQIIFREAPKPLENVRLRGEDLRAGSLLVSPGQKLTPNRLALLAACGHQTAPVFAAPKVALLGAGNELREPGDALAAGEIFESNRAAISGFLQDIGIPSRPLPIVRDDLPATIAAFENAFQDADIVISTGGVSVGDFDFVKEAFEKAGGTIALWRIAMRPGKPFVFGRHGLKFFFGLPGNPVSAIVTFLVLVRPALLKMLGAAQVALPQLPAVLEDRVVNAADRRHFLRVRWQKGKASVAGPQKSHMLASLGSANGLLDVPAGVTLEPGTPVTVSLWSLPEDQD